MKKITGMTCLIFLASCSYIEVKKENEELLQLTKALTERVEELQQIAENAAEEAMIAQVEAEAQAQLALDQAARAIQTRAELEERLRNCK